MRKIIDQLFQYSKKDIINYFNNLEIKIFSKKDIIDILKKNIDIWKLPDSLTTTRFINLLIKKASLKKHNFKFPNKVYNKYSWQKVSFYEVILSLIPNCHFTHFTAMFFLNLTTQIPKTIYFRTELNYDVKNDNKLLQESIDRAFTNKQRLSNNIALYNDFKLFLLYGKKTDNLGVIDLDTDYGKLKITNLERTLIDITVRPSYSGGISEVLNAFKKAQAEVSINKLISYLRKLNYSYPYHQVIGYYIEKAGNYNNNQISQLKNFEMKYDFYLDYKIDKKKYIKKWKLYVPDSF